MFLRRNIFEEEMKGLTNQSAELDVHKGKLKNFEEIQSSVILHSVPLPSNTPEDHEKGKEKEKEKEREEESNSNRTPSDPRGWQRGLLVEDEGKVRKGTKINARLKNLARMEMEVSVLPKVFHSPTWIQNINDFWE